MAGAWGLQIGAATLATCPPNSPARGGLSDQVENLEASTGIEPVYTDLQSGNELIHR